MLARSLQTNGKRTDFLLTLVFRYVCCPGTFITTALLSGLPCTLPLGPVHLWWSQTDGRWHSGEDVPLLIQLSFFLFNQSMASSTFPYPPKDGVGQTVG